MAGGIMDPVDFAQWNPDEPPQAVLAGAGASMRQVHVKAGHIATRHSHPHEQFLLVISGAGRLECEAGSVPLHPGTAIRFAPGAWHSAEFTADTVLTEFNLTPPEGAEAAS
jgi:quercetin dioxygenase-like cupin family protein